MPTPSKIGRYEILAELGQGATGAVYKARDPMMDRTVAIKVIRTTGISDEELQKYKERFQREARAAGKMSHPGIVTIYDIAEDDRGHPYLVMEFVEGDTLYGVLRPDDKGKLPQRPPLPKSLDIAIQVAEALAYAHGRGVIHRDIKPANILLTADGRAKITDFGVAKLTGTEGTQTARVVGTPAYMSPEQCQGGKVDARSDIFSLGATLYWMCTGEKPFPGDTLSAVAFKIVYEEPRPPRQIDPSLSPDLETLLLRCLAKKPEVRYPNAAELAKDLTALRAGRKREVGARSGSVQLTRMPGAAAAALARFKQEWERLFPGSWRYAPVAVVLFLLVVALGIWLWPRHPDSQAVAQQTAAAAPVATPSAGSQAASAIQPEAETAKPAESEEAKAAEETPPEENPPSEPAVSSPKQAANPAAGVKTKTAKEVPPPAVAVQAEPVPAPAPSKTPPAPVPVEEKPAAPVARKAAPGAKNATLQIECSHNFREAKIEVLSDGRSIFSGELVGESRVLARPSGVLRGSAAIAPGEHTLTVRVVSERDNYRGEAEIGGTFAEGDSRLLHIDFGKGSGLGFKGRKLALSLR